VLGAQHRACQSFRSLDRLGKNLVRFGKVPGPGKRTPEALEDFRAPSDLPARASSFA